MFDEKEVRELSGTLKPCPICGAENPAIIIYGQSRQVVALNLDITSSPDPVEPQCRVHCLSASGKRYCGIKSDGLLDMEAVKFFVDGWNAASEARWGERDEG